MRQRWRAWAAAGVAVVVVGAVPLVLDRDSFPLSTFPMFAADIDRTQSIDTAVAVRGRRLDRTARRRPRSAARRW